MSSAAGVPVRFQGQASIAPGPLNNSLEEVEWRAGKASWGPGAIQPREEDCPQCCPVKEAGLSRLGDKEVRLC